MGEITKTAEERKAERETSSKTKEVFFQVFPSVTDRHEFYNRYEIFSYTFTGVVLRAERKRKVKQEDILEHLLAY